MAEHRLSPLHTTPYHSGSGCPQVSESVLTGWASASRNSPGDAEPSDGVKTMDRTLSPSQSGNKLLAKRGLKYDLFSSKGFWGSITPGVPVRAARTLGEREMAMKFSWQAFLRSLAKLFSALSMPTGFTNGQLWLLRKKITNYGN